LLIFNVLLSYKNSCLSSLLKVKDISLFFNLKILKNNNIIILNFIIINF